MITSSPRFENDESYKHLDESLDVYRTMTVSNIDDDALNLCFSLFPLKMKIKHLLKSLSSTIRIITWEEIEWWDLRSISSFIQ